jgi:hypothetical protein
MRRAADALQGVKDALERGGRPGASEVKWVSEALRFKRGGGMALRSPRRRFRAWVSS